MKYLLIITLTILFAGCVTINKTYLPQAKKDTVYLPCNQIHLQQAPLKQWPNWEYPLHIPGIIDTSVWRGGGSIRVWSNDSVYIINDTLRKLYDTTKFFGGGGYAIPDSARVRKP